MDRKKMVCRVNIYFAPDCNVAEEIRCDSPLSMEVPNSSSSVFVGVDNDAFKSWQLKLRSLFAAAAAAVAAAELL